MDENFNKPENVNESSNDNDSVDTTDKNNSGIKTFTMDEDGDIHVSRSSTATVTGNTKTFIVLGWISAALTILISPYFAAAGVTFGILVNRQIPGSGNAVIITNIVLAVANFILGFVFVLALRRMMLGY